ncbi:MAG TPA: alcohol dehydrogenase catalytic domain-containing protein, partial [bacterium]
MKAIVLHSVGEPDALRLEEVPDPAPGPGQVVVRLRAAALNHRDLWICRGQYAGIRFPIIPGADGVGEIAAVGQGVTGVSPGASVVI